MGETQKNCVDGQNGRSPHLKYHSQLKAKEDVEGGESQAWESIMNKGEVVVQT